MGLWVYAAKSYSTTEIKGVEVNTNEMKGLAFFG